MWWVTEIWESGDGMIDRYDPNFVVLGGGTGISTLLRGLKRFSKNITAIVTMADDGGSSGMLRRDYGMLPPGDIRNCLVALANAEPSLEQLLQYRFSDGKLEGQNMGNLILAALSDLYGGFAEGVGEAAQVLRITGKVLPVTMESIRLVATFSDESELMGESLIPKYAWEHDLAINSIRFDTENPEVNPECLHAIEEANMIVLGPGSLYTSLIPNVIVPGIADAIARSEAPLVYVANVMEQRGETEGMSLTDHIQALKDHGLSRPIDYALVNDGEVQSDILSRYSEKGVAPIFVSEEEKTTLLSRGIEVESGSFAFYKEGYIRHDGLMVAQRLLSLCDRYHEIHCTGRETAL